MDLKYSDRIYKTIDAYIGHNKFIRILSTIDTDENITVEFYNYSKEDIDKTNGIIKTKRNAYITKPINKDKFDEMIIKFSEIYPEFKIISLIDLSNMTLKESIETIKKLNLGKISQETD